MKCIKEDYSMKKMVFGIFSFLLLSMSAFAMDGYIRAGFTTNSKSYNRERGGFEQYSPNISAEIRQSLAFADVGAGIGYYHRVGGSSISTVPVYVLAKWNVFPLLPVKPYVVGRVGRILKTSEDVKGSDPSGREFYAVGAGMEVFDLEVEANYSATRIRQDHRGSDWLNQVSLGAAYKIF